MNKQKMRNALNVLLRILDFIFSPSMLFILTPIAMVGFFIYATILVWSYGFTALAIGVGFLGIIMLRQIFEILPFKSIRDVEINNLSCAYKRPARRCGNCLKKQQKKKQQNEH